MAEITVPLPDVGECYGHAWRQMLRVFLELLIITVVLLLLSMPLAGFETADAEGFAPFLFLIFLITLAYLVLFYRPLEYGVAYASLRAARGESVEISDMFSFFPNYPNAVLAHILVGFLTGVGVMFCIVPGIYIACKLAFVPYLVIDRNMGAIEAIRESWRLTDGHALNIFLIGVLAIPIVLGGLLLCGVGVLVSSMWIRVTFASIYHAVTAAEPAD